MPLTTFQTILLGLALYIAVRIVLARYRKDRLGLTDKPDLPLPFGQQIGWIAINTTNTGKVARALQLGKKELLVETKGDGGVDYYYWNAGLALGFHEKFSLDLRYWDTELNGCGDATIFQCDERFVATLSASF